MNFFLLWTKGFFFLTSTGSEYAPGNPLQKSSLRRRRVWPGSTCLRPRRRSRRRRRPGIMWSRAAMSSQQKELCSQVLHKNLGKEKWNDLISILLYGWKSKRDCTYLRWGKIKFRCRAQNKCFRRLFVSCDPPRCEHCGRMAGPMGIKITAVWYEIGVGTKRRAKAKVWIVHLSKNNKGGGGVKDLGGFRALRATNLSCLNLLS